MDVQSGTLSAGGDVTSPTSRGIFSFRFFLLLTFAFGVSSSRGPVDSRARMKILAFSERSLTANPFFFFLFPLPASAKIFFYHEDEVLCGFSGGGVVSTTCRPSFFSFLPFPFSVASLRGDFNARASRPVPGGVTSRGAGASTCSPPETVAEKLRPPDSFFSFRLFLFFFFFFAGGNGVKSSQRARWSFVTEAI